MQLTKLIKELNVVKGKEQELHQAYKNNLIYLQQEITRLERKINFSKAGLDLEKVTHGMNVINFGETKGVPERKQCVKDAISDLAYGGEKLKKEYFGTKDYAHWTDQRYDTPYGWGPTHGSIVFKVALTPKYRKVNLSEWDIECAIYCLLNIDEINKQILGV
jgi:hypothetical protein